MPAAQSQRADRTDRPTDGDHPSDESPGPGRLDRRGESRAPTRLRWAGFDLLALLVGPAARRVRRRHASTRWSPWGFVVLAVVVAVLAGAVVLRGTCRRAHGCWSTGTR